MGAVEVLQAGCWAGMGALSLVAARLCVAEVRARAGILLRIRRVGGLTFLRMGRMQLSFCRVREG
jgi:hypothetical protein